MSIEIPTYSIVFGQGNVLPILSVLRLRVRPITPTSAAGCPSLQVDVASNHVLEETVLRLFPSFCMPMTLCHSTFTAIETNSQQDSTAMESPSTIRRRMRSFLGPYLLHQPSEKYEGCSVCRRERFLLASDLVQRPSQHNSIAIAKSHLTSHQYQSALKASEDLLRPVARIQPTELFKPRCHGKKCPGCCFLRGYLQQQGLLHSSSKGLLLELSVTADSRALILEVTNGKWRHSGGVFCNDPRECRHLLYHEMGRLHPRHYYRDPADAWRSFRLVFHHLPEHDDDIKIFGTGFCRQPQAQPSESSLIPRWSGSSQCMGELESWIGDCQENHESCRPESYTPKRLIDVSRSADLVFLTESDRIPRARDSRYISLSHCWGTAKPIATTRESYQDHINGIRLDALPRTFRDAVSVARSLCVGYLWIDSLCIVQDDAQDWAEQAGQMGNIYSACYLTVAAATANDSSAGILSLRQVCDLDTIPVPGGYARVYSQHSLRIPDRHYEQVHDIYRRFGPQLSYPLTNSEKTSVPAEEWNDPESRERFLSENPGAMLTYPLMTRGWALQERFLSSRIAHFTRTEILFECKTTSRCECGISSDAPPLAFRGITGPGRLQRTYEQAVTGWREIVEVYSGLALTKHADILPALSGLARRFHMTQLQGSGPPADDDGYFAGLWQSQFPHNLLWETMWTRGSVDKSSGQYYVPTWSWASAKGAVRHIIPEKCFKNRSWKDFSKGSTSWHFVDGLNVDPRFVVQQLSRDLTGPDEYGQIMNSTLVVTGYVFYPRASSNNSQLPPDLFECYFHDQRRETPFRSFKMQRKRERPCQGGETYMVLMYLSDDNLLSPYRRHQMLYGLILDDNFQNQSSGCKVFTRIGTFEADFLSDSIATCTDGWEPDLQSTFSQIRGGSVITAEII